ncbi:unannotated protein [freshwater metagenome]|uniref:Unannotated protein n=1 Tax=freshwater metagenome TaxID=449393 RepID=A0A6J7XQV0_9ZZZZ|nr:DUF3093 family protein [Actinomycetota bacterium]
MRFREVQRPPIWLLALFYFFFLSLVIAIWAALGNLAALISLVVLTGTLVFIWFIFALVIEVVGSQLRIGNAQIDISYLGHCESLSAADMRRARTRDIDPAAHLEIRFWVSEGIKIALNDSRDPTPYWLVSTSRADELIAILKN